MGAFESVGESMMGQMYSHGIKKFIWDILKENYSKNEQAIEEISKAVNSPKSYQYVGELMAAIYQAGFIQAVDEHREILKQRGFEAKVVSRPMPQPTKDIFRQEKSG